MAAPLASDGEAPAVEHGDAEIADTPTDGSDGRTKGKGKGKSKGPRLKELVVLLFGAERQLGSFMSPLHSDLRHLVEFLRRGKLPRLDASRLEALEAAFAAAPPPSPFKSVAELRGQIEAWRAESRGAFDAESYYDGARTAGYTEKNSGPQENLARRALQLCSLDTSARPSAAAAAARPPRENLLAVDLGCGSGLSTFVASRLPRYNLGVIGVDLSSEMLRASSWQEISAAESPLAAERVRCDLGQPLPFRAGTFDVAYSVAAVHYLAQDTLYRKAEQRLDTFLASLRATLRETARPCALQAFFTREPKAVKLFMEASERTGWALCSLVIDKAHGAGGADRDFLYLVPQTPPLGGAARPAGCPLYEEKAGATCALSVEEWAEARGVPAPQLEAVHRAWLVREHERFAKRLVRLQERCGGSGADGAPLQLDHASPPGEAEAALAVRLAKLLREAGPATGGQEEDEEALRVALERRQARIIAELHAAASPAVPPPVAAPSDPAPVASTS